MIRSEDELYIRRCIELANNGLGMTYPNPLVGAVIVYKGVIIGEGWHKRAGESHAEINAINSVRKENKSLLKDSEIYISLEPCSHYGKTPPCVNKIIQIEFKRVVIGSLDPSEKINGEGYRLLKKAGIIVKKNVLEAECINLNKRFFTFHRKKKPYVILKWAETANKKIDNGLDRNQPFWISNKYSLQKTHLIRSQEQAILVGKNTALIDNPYLTCRNIKGNNPIRILIDKNLDIPITYNIFNEEASTIIFNSKIDKKEKHLNYIKIDFLKSIPIQVLDKLYRFNIQSLIVEGGRKTLQDFIDTNLWDEAIITSSIQMVNQGTDAPILKGELFKREQYEDDSMLYIKNNNVK